MAQAQTAEARADAAEEALADTQARAAADAQTAADAQAAAEQRARVAEEALAAAEAQAAADAQAAREAALAAEQALAAVDQLAEVSPETEPAFVEVEVIVHTGSGRGGGSDDPIVVAFSKDSAANVVGPDELRTSMVGGLILPPNGSGDDRLREGRRSLVGSILGACCPGTELWQ